MPRTMLVAAVAALTVLTVLPAAAAPLSPTTVPPSGAPVVRAATGSLDGTVGAFLRAALNGDDTGASEVADRPYQQQALYAPQQSSVSLAADYCGDSTAPADVWQAIIAETADGPIFITRHCDAFVPSSQFGADGTTAFLIEAGIDGDGLDYIVGFGSDSSAPSGIGVVVIRTPSNSNTGTWAVTAEGPAQHPVANEYGALIPRVAMPASQYLYAHDHRGPGGSGADYLPELGEEGFAPLLHPNPCQALAQADTGHAPTTTMTVHGPEPVLDLAARLLTDAGIGVLDSNTDLGFLGVNAPAGHPAATALLDRLGLTGEPTTAYVAHGVPTDPRFADQWGHTQIGSQAAWDVRTTSTATIAVIDSGVDGTHPDLTTSGLYNSVHGRTDSGTNNARGFHGSAVASVTAATANNGAHGAGVTWGQPVLGINAFDANGCTTSAWLADAIRAAADRGADVINLSLGNPSGQSDAAVDAAIGHAVSQGAIIIASSGNAGTSTVAHPANHPDVIAVGATGRHGNIASYSQTGPQIDVVAPGGDEGDEDDLVYVVTDNFGETHTAGTSFSAPVLAGAAALWLGGNPDGDVNAFRAALASTSVDLGAAGRDPVYGHGLLDLPALLGGSGGPVDPPAGPTPPPSGSTDTGRLFIASGSDAAGVSGFVNIIRFSRDNDAAHAVIGRSDVFADSLAGTSLTTDGPLLYSESDGLSYRTEIELEDLPFGATVYLLGGEAALSPAVEGRIRELGFNPVRLAGPSRIDTALVIASEALRLNPAAREVAIARADNWADSVTAGAWAAATGQPIIITPTDSLAPQVRDWLAARSFDAIHVLGGTAAISSQVESEIRAVAGGASVGRVAGPSRSGTAAAVAANLLPDAHDTVVVPGFDDRGWVPGLAAAGMGAEGAALYLTGDTVPEETRQRLATHDNCFDITVVMLDGQVADTALGDAADLGGCT